MVKEWGLLKDYHYPNWLPLFVLESSYKSYAYFQTRKEFFDLILPQLGN